METRIEDWFLAGYLALSPGIEVIPSSENGRVIFSVRGNTETPLKELYENKPVPILDLMKSVRACRTSIFVLRGQGHKGGENEAA